MILKDSESFFVNFGQVAFASAPFESVISYQTKTTPADESFLKLQLFTNELIINELTTIKWLYYSSINVLYVR